MIDYDLFRVTIDVHGETFEVPERAYSEQEATIKAINRFSGVYLDSPTVEDVEKV